MRTFTSDGTMYTFTLADSHDSFLAAIPSTALHAVLIAAAIAAGRTAAVVSPDPMPVLIDWPLPATPSTPAQHTMSGIPGAPIVLCNCPLLDAPDLPPIDLPGLPQPVDPTTLVPGTHSTLPGFPGGDAGHAATILTESEVDELPVLLAAGALRYPAVLAAARMSGSVTLEFVIDVEGRVAPEGLKILSSTHQGFVAAAQEAVQTTRFRPARKNGHPVPVRVRQTVTFRP
jgi:TonB family protein